MWDKIVFCTANEVGNCQRNNYTLATDDTNEEEEEEEDLYNILSDIMTLRKGSFRISRRSFRPIFD